MKRYQLKPVNVNDYANDAFYMAIKETKNSKGKWVKYSDVKKLETALKIIAVWTYFPDTTLAEIRKKALKALGK